MSVDRDDSADGAVKGAIKELTPEEKV